jgi:dienelactone hydrolase
MQLLQSSTNSMHQLIFASLVGFTFFLGGCTSSGLNGILRETATVGPQGPEEGRFRRQHWLVPSPDQYKLMAATLWRPRGPGPFPFAVISHASTQDAHERIEDPTPRYENVALWFVRHGYAVVLPVRPGHGATGGPYVEDQGGCEDADYVKSGFAIAATVETTVDYMTAQPFLKKDHVVIVGQSAGGWGALALASRNPPAVSAVINFAGGRGGHSLGEPNTNCAPGRLIAAAGEFGRAVHLPTLWIYAENDSYFAPDLSKRMADAFRLGGGPVEYHLLPPFAEDGHFMLLASNGPTIWAPIVEKFLAKSR